MKNLAVRILFIVLAVIGFACCNTENLRFSNSDLSDDRYSVASLNLGPHASHSFHIIQNVPPIGEYDTVWFKIATDQGAAPLEARVCWPASQPTDFTLIYEKGHVGVKYAAEFYSVDKELMKRPRDITIDVVLNKVTFGLPSDIIQTIALLPLGIAAGTLLGRYLFEYIEECI